MEASRKREADFVIAERFLISQGKGSKEEKNLGERDRIWKELILDGFDFSQKRRDKVIY